MNAPGRAGPLRRRNRPAVPATYGAISVVLVGAAVALALSTPPPSTPPLAAVAPAPQDQIEVERLEQGTRFGDGTGGDLHCNPGTPGCSGTGASADDEAPDDPLSPSTSEIIETQAPANLRRCIHGPGGSRQTEDPQAPPCKAEIFSGDNGGATSRGVTAAEVRVAVPSWGSRQDDEDALVKHFNDRYEFYGRKLVVDFVDTSEYESSPTGRRALAKDIAGRDVFASLSVSFRASEAFHRALAEAGVVSVFRPSFTLVSESTLARHHPYLWSAWPTAEEAGAATGTLVCRSLLGRPAQHGGDDVRDRIRVFGVLFETHQGDRIAPEPLVSALRACDAPHSVYERNRDDQDTVSVDVLVQRMVADGVTTVACLCHNDSIGEITGAAEAVGYHPEWLNAGTDDADIGKELPREQRAHVFGLTPDHRRITFLGGNTPRHDEHYWFTAMREADGDVTPEHSSLYETYAQLLVLASGIQWAGPELTPESFGAALAGLRFANPDVGRSPWWQPAVGFGPDDHGFNSDFALIWWRNEPAEMESVQTGPKGELCYVADGLRFTAATMPASADDSLFDPEAGCR